MSSVKRWRKILYKDQGVVDNYTDDSFLDVLKQNLTVKTYDIREVIFESGVVSQQVCTVSIFITVFIYLDSDVIKPMLLILLSFSSTIVYVALKIITVGESFSLEGFVTIPALVFAMSPILKTLTKTISTDTIYAMTTGMLIINLLVYDYGAGVAMVSKAISLNAGIFAAVCLGSRLPTSWHVYSYVMLAIQLFALFPEIRKNVKSLHRKAYILLTESLVVVAALLLVPLNHTVAFALLLVHIAVTLLFPLWMIHLQRLKNNIRGPWDEAMIMR